MISNLHLILIVGIYNTTGSKIYYDTSPEFSDIDEDLENEISHDAQPTLNPIKVNAFIGINDPFSVRFTSSKIKQMNTPLWKNVKPVTMESPAKFSNTHLSWSELINSLSPDAKSFTFETPEIRKTSLFGGISNWLYSKPPGTKRIFLTQVSPLPGLHWSIIIEDKELNFGTFNRSKDTEYNAITISTRLHRLKYKSIVQRKTQDSSYTIDKMASFYYTKYMTPYCDTSLTDDEIWARLEKPIVNAIYHKFRMFRSNRNCLSFAKSAVEAICDPDKIFGLAKLFNTLSEPLIKAVDAVDSMVSGEIIDE